MRKRAVTIALALAVLMPAVVFADTKADALNQLKSGGVEAGYGEESRDVRLIANDMIMVFVGMLGIGVTGLFLYAGYLFLTSHGEQDKLTRARKTMQGAVIGLILILMSSTIAYFVGQRAQEVVQGDNASLQLE